MAASFVCAEHRVVGLNGDSASSSRRMTLLLGNDDRRETRR
jgi:hypothetical protein